MLFIWPYNAQCADVDFGHLCRSRLVGSCATFTRSRFWPKRCRDCSQKEHCTRGKYRMIAIHVCEAARQKAYALAQTPQFAEALRKCGSTVLGTEEPGGTAPTPATPDQVRARTVLPGSCSTESETVGAIPCRPATTGRGLQPKQKRRSRKPTRSVKANNRQPTPCFNRLFQHPRDISSTDRVRASEAPSRLC